MRRVQLVLLGLGVALFVFVIQDVGVGAIVEGLARIGWSFLALFAFEILIDVLHSEGWHWCLAEHRSRIRRFDLLLARTAGFAVNTVTPTATVGGEVVKGLLIRRWVPLADGFASVIVDKLTFAVGQGIFLLAGAFVVLADVPLTDGQRALALGGLLLWIAGVVAFFFLQRAGLFRVGLGVLRALFGGSDLVQRLPGSAQQFDARVSVLLDGHRKEVAISAMFHLAAHPLRGFQFYFALAGLGFEPTLLACFTAACGLVFIEATLFLIPGKLGVYEGGHRLLFESLGFGAPVGLAISFAMRLSELTSAALGLLALAWFQFQGTTTTLEPAPDEEDEGSSDRRSA